MCSLRAIDVYSGVGGWSLGLALAGIEVVCSYEWSEVANETNRTNNGHPTKSVNIRTMDLSELPSGIDVVVGSPPCTQFSYSNRGGGGNLSDGLKDIVRFFEIVEACKPKFWAMENVPRVAAIMEREFAEQGALHRFAHLGPLFKIISADKIGLPQRRKRCLVSNCDLGGIDAFAAQPPVLGQVVQALKTDLVVDPIYDLQCPRSAITDLTYEANLNEEEIRINGASKALHPVYNVMQFPDPLDRTSRTVTATCTRVSRESIVIHDVEQGGYRRLSLREKACLQGFPVSFQFMADSHGAKEVMIGNAMPPPLAYQIGHVMQGTPRENIPPLSSLHAQLRTASLRAPLTAPHDGSTHKYSAHRRFQFAIPSLHLKSGVRFEMINDSHVEQTLWAVEFVFGSSKDIFRIRPNDTIAQEILPGEGVPQGAKKHIFEFQATLAQMDVRRMQTLWAHRGPGGTRPFALLDELSTVGSALAYDLAPLDSLDLAAQLKTALSAHFAPLQLVGFEKLKFNVHKVVSGILLGAAANALLCPENPSRAINASRT